MNEDTCLDPRELSDAAGRLWELYENAPVPYVTFGLDFRVLTVNKAFREFLGAAGPPRDKVTDYLDPESLEDFVSHIRGLQAPDSPGTGAIYVSLQPGSFRVKAESNIWKPRGQWEFRTTLTDITGAYAAEQALKASEARFKTVVEHLTDGIMIMDDQAKILVWNSTIAAISGFPSDQVVGTYIWDMQLLLAPSEKKIPGALEKLKTFNLAYIEALKAGAPPKVHENRLQRPDGTLRTIQFSINFLQTGAETLFVTTFRDVTQSKALEAELVQAKKMEAIGLLVGGIAHDFNNFLGAIFGRLELAKLRPTLGLEVRGDLAKIESSALNAAKMTKKLLMYARKDTLLYEVVDLNEVLGDLQPGLLRLAGEEIDLSVRLHPGPMPVRLGRDQIDQIVTNLCLNARDAIPGLGRIAVSTGFDSPGDRVVLQVEDSGIGMDKPTLVKIFEPFFTTKRLGAGTGLGLATVHGIVYQNEGEIRVESQPGHGTQFSVILPLYRGPLVSSSPETAVDGQTLQGTVRIWVVEDEPEILEFVVRSLEAGGHQVLGSPSAEQALASWVPGTTGPDLLITDVMLPGKNGRDLAREVHGRSPATRVLYISGYSGDVLAQQGVLTEELDFLPKPFTLDDLKAKVALCLAGG